MFNLSQSIVKTISTMQRAAHTYEEICNFSLKFSDFVIHLNRNPFFERVMISSVHVFLLKMQKLI